MNVQPAERTFDMLETCCFPKGCRIADEMQPMLATVLIPKLEAAGMKTAEWTRGALMLEEPLLSQVKAVVCRGCAIYDCEHNPQHGRQSGDLMFEMYNWGYGDRREKNKDLLEALLPNQFITEMVAKGVIVEMMEPSTSNKWFNMHAGVEHSTKGKISIMLRRKKGEQGVISVYGAVKATYPMPNSAAATSQKLREIIEAFA
ncbi:MAG: hypothetical protein Q7S95_01085 [bacterium]|nr:hypothetical protein [bacterium]